MAPGSNRWRQGLQARAARPMEIGSKDYVSTMPNDDHRRLLVESVACHVLTVSDTRTVETDDGGRLIRERLGDAGHRLCGHEILPDEPATVRDRVLSLCDDEDCQAVLLTGGTGLARRDTTYEAIISLIEKRIDGFGELFRLLSFEEIGAAAMLSRATAGVRHGTLVFSMPGSVDAVRLAMDRLILPQIGHMAALVVKH